MKLIIEKIKEPTELQKFFMEKDTPRTDAIAEYWLAPGLRDECEIVRADFARELERENAELRRLIEEVTVWHKTTSSGEYNECEKHPCYWCEQANDILSNAKGHGSPPAADVANTQENL